MVYTYQLIRTTKNYWKNNRNM